MTAAPEIAIGYLNGEAIAIDVVEVECGHMMRADVAQQVADKPGHSKHQEGLAIDLKFNSEADREDFAALAVAHGFARPTPEKWHFVVSPQKG